MKRFPDKFSPIWFRVFAFYIVVVYAFLSLPQIILKSEIVLRPLIALAMLAVAVALIACIVGYLGGKVFFLVYSAFAFVGTLYMLNIVLFDTTSGWGDLTSFIGFITFVVFGLGAGVLAEGVHFLIKVGEKRNSRA